VALLVSMFVISRYVLPLVERRDRGAIGEEQVGAVLDALPSEQRTVIHDASLGRGNVDHIVIGRAGVFTVETKSHPGPVRVGRVHGATLSQAHAQRRAVERVTGVEVEPLIAYSRAWVDKPMARRKGVRVLPARMLPGYLAKRPQKLSEQQVEQAQVRLAQALLEERARSKAAHEYRNLIR
jgi:Nuclease-related domain